MAASVGVLLNPIAGFGGALALHGTDALPASRFDEAVAAGHAERRLVRAIEVYRAAGGEAALVAGPGLLGSEALAAAGIERRSAGESVSAGRTTRHDTIAAARRLVAEGVDGLIFAGGDGTAADLAEALGDGFPVIGVPSGVKMHSEVFARSPEGAGRLLAEFTAGRTVSELADVLDVGADGTTDVIAALLVPRSSEPLQGAKAAARRSSSTAAGLAVARELVASDDASTTWMIGPGTTAGAVAEALGFVPTLRGVDVRHPTGSVEHDVDEARLHDVATAAAQPRLVVGVVGGQGFLLGRGNQQISPRVVRAVGVERIEIVATEEKVGALFPPVLLVDVDPDPERAQERAAGGGGTRHPLLGYRRVRTGFRQSTVLKVIDAATVA